MNCGSSAGTIEYPSRPRISAAQMAPIIVGEGPVEAELDEFTQTYLCSLWPAHGVRSGRLRASEYPSLHRGLREPLRGIRAPVVRRIRTLFHGRIGTGP